MWCLKGKDQRQLGKGTNNPEHFLKQIYEAYNNILSFS